MKEDRLKVVAVPARALGLCMALLVCAVPTHGQRGEVPPGNMERALNLEAGKIEEPCFTLAMTDRLEYSFNSDSPLDFNLHYHEGQGVYFPVEMKNVSAHKGAFVATGSRKYCLMWTNRGEAALELHYDYQLFRGEAMQ